MAYTNTYRYRTAPANGGQNQLPYREIQNPAYATTAVITALDANSEKIVVDMQKLTGAITLTADLVNPCSGDEMVIMFAADGTNRVVTFSTGFNTAGTITCLANKFATITFVFSGAAYAWVEKGRYVQA